ncbi:hypothetical protein ACNUDN_04584 [Mycobacterium sp. smrl_JER01]
MFYKRHSPGLRILRKLRSSRTFRPILSFAAGIHAAGGIAHGVQPSPVSAARR